MPQQNGVAEQKNRHTVEIAHALMRDKGDAAIILGKSYTYRCLYHE